MISYQKSTNSTPPDTAAMLTRRLFGCYRKDDAANSELLITSVAALLCRYPVEVSEKVTHPIDGLPGKNPFPPSIAEVKAACEDENAFYERMAARENRRLEAQKLLAPPSVSEEERAIVSQRMMALAQEMRHRAGRTDEQESNARRKSLQAVSQRVIAAEYDAMGLKMPAKAIPVSSSMRAYIHENPLPQSEENMEACA